MTAVAVPLLRTLHATAAPAVRNERLFGDLHNSPREMGWLQNGSLW